MQGEQIMANAYEPASKILSRVVNPEWGKNTPIEIKYNYLVMVQM